MIVTVAEHRQIVHDGTHHHTGATLDVDEDTARTWIRRGWATTAKPPPEPDTPAKKQGRANVQARIIEELRADPTRSDREIAKAIGCDHKTVAARRRALFGETPQPDASL